MTEKRFTILYGIDENPYEWDIMDNEKDALICQCNGKPICDLLNALYEENKQLKQKVDFYKYFQKDARELEKENEQLKERNDRQYNQLKQLWELIEDEDYNTLRSMLNQRETDEKLLQKEWGTYSD